MNNIYRNGDWHFVPTNEELKGDKVEHKGEVVFAEGEATGHFHIIKVPDPKDMQVYKLADGSWMVDLSCDGVATHPEHSLKGDLVIPKGRYKLVQRREKCWFSLATRKVVD